MEKILAIMSAWIKLKFTKQIKFIVKKNIEKLGKITTKISNTKWGKEFLMCKYGQNSYRYVSLNKIKMSENELTLL